jgi:hypothetical protein
VQTLKPQHDRDIVFMVTALEFAASQYLTEESLLRLVQGCNTEDAIVDKLATRGFVVGLAVLLARVLAPLLGIQPVRIGQGKR